MYATAGKIFGMYNPPESNLNHIENFQTHKLHNHIHEHSHNHQHVHEHDHNNKQNGLKLRWATKNVQSTANPAVWGRPYWISKHISAAHYPVQASKLTKERMKGAILAIPYEIPCAACRPHANAFIESKSEELDNIVSGRKQLFNFYVDFHNKVNERHNKKVWSYEEAWEVYHNGAQISYLE